jgi:hypothetical protein
MRNITNDMAAALADAPQKGLVPRRYVWVTAKDRETGLPVSEGFWSGDEDVMINVIDGRLGTIVARGYRGAGQLLQISPIPRVSDLTEQTVTIDLSQIAPAVQQLVRGYDVRLARVEIHEMTHSTISRQPVSPPEPVFVGVVDGAPINTPAVGGDGKAELRCVSDAISMLTRTNPRKSSYEAQKLRSGDEWGLYSGSVAGWDIKWGANS